MTAFSQLEFRILDWVAKTFHSSFLDAIMPAVSFLADGAWIWILFALLFMIRKSTRKIGLAVILSLLLSLLTANIILKPLVARPRPFVLNPSIALLIPAPTDYSFPSGHAQASFAAATAIYRFKKWPGRAALLLAAGIAFSRLYLFVHFLGDVAGGAAIGYILGRIAYAMISSMRYRYRIGRLRKRTRKRRNR
ncbi:MAG: phosphatase PAP2 family protein [Clostridiales bacterium]|nr:phosphatase PAP2 family protein [Clostridiales bacterium]